MEIVAGGYTQDRLVAEKAAPVPAMSLSHRNTLVNRLFACPFFSTALRRPRLHEGPTPHTHIVFHHDTKGSPRPSAAVLFVFPEDVIPGAPEGKPCPAAIVAKLA